MHPSDQIGIRELHLARLKRGLARIPELRTRDPLRDDPEFDAWRSEMMDSLDAILPNSNYSLQLANTSFRDHASTYAYDFIPDHAQYRLNGLRRAEILLTNAIEEAEVTPGDPPARVSEHEKGTGIVINVTNVLSQTAHVEVAQLFTLIDGLRLPEEKRDEAKKLAREIDEEIRGQQRWPVLGRALQGLQLLGKDAYNRIAVPLLLELLKRQTGL